MARETVSFLTMLRWQGRFSDAQSHAERRNEPVRSRIQAAKVQDVPRHQGLQRLKTAEDGVADGNEGEKRAVQATCEADRVEVSSQLSQIA